MKILRERAEKGIARADYDDLDEEYFKSFLDQKFQVDLQNQDKLHWEKFMRKITKGKDYDDPDTLLKEFVLNDSVDKGLEQFVDKFLLDDSDEDSGQDNP